MYDSVAMDELDCDADVSDQGLNSFFRNLEVSLVEILKHVTALQKFKHQINALYVLKYINQMHDIRVLANFQHLYFVSEHV